MVNIYYAWNKREWNQRQWNSISNELNEDILARGRRYHQWRDAQFYITGRLLLAKIFNRPVNQLHFSYNNNGRPCLRDEYDFNISHSGELLVCAICSKGGIGIDIEKIDDISVDDFRAVLLDEEWNAITSSGEWAVQHFFEYWTKKEAALKAYGTGLSLPLTDVRITSDKALIKDTIWYLKPAYLSPSYSCHLAMEINQPISNVYDLTSFVDQYIHQ